MKIVDKMVISCGDTTVRMWSLPHGKLLHTLDLPDSCTDFDLNSESTLLAVAHAIGVSIYDLSSVAQIMEIDFTPFINVRQSDYVTDVRFNESGRKLSVAQHNGQVSKIDLY